LLNGNQLVYPTFIRHYRCALVQAEICAGATRLDDLLDDLFHLIPIFCFHPCHLAAEVLLDICKLPPAILIINKADTDANATKTTSSTNSMQVGLWVCVSLGVLGIVL